MAKPFSETVNIQPQTIATGQPQALMSLSEKLDSFAGFTAQIAAEKTVEKASIAGQQAAADLAPGQAPTMKEETFVGGIAKKAYNSALRSSYVGTVTRDLNLNLNAIKDNNSSNLGAFNDEANAAIKGAVEGADPATRQLILQDAANFMDSARIDVQTANIERNMAEADAESVVTSDYFGSEADKYAFNGDALSSMESLNKSIAMIDGRVQSGAIDPSQAALLKDDVIFSTKVATNRGELSRVLDKPNGIKLASAAVAQIREKPLKGMTLEQNDELAKTLTSDISQFITAQNRQEVADEAMLKSIQARTSTGFAVAMAEGTLKQSDLNVAAKKGLLSEPQFTKLSEKLSSQGVGVTDINLQLELQNSIIGGFNVSEDIINNMGVNLSQADAGALLKMQQEYSSEESVLNSNRTKRARNFLTESTKITGLMGRLTSDGSRRTADAIRKFDERVLAGEDPFVVADDLYDHDSLTKVQKKLTRRGIDTNDVPKAITHLTDNFKIEFKAAKGDTRKQEDLKKTYNRDLSDLQNLSDLQASQSIFVNALKEVR